MNGKVRKLLPRIVLYLFVLFLIISLNFIIIRSMPGDPLLNILGEEDYYFLSTRQPETLEMLRVKFDLTGSKWEQYWNYLNQIMHLDFGYSYSYAMPVMQVVASKLGWTLLLTVPSILLAALLSGVLGLWCGWKQGKLEKFLTPVFFFLNSIPAYCIGILSLYHVAFRTKWFPVAGMATAGTAGWERVVDIMWHMVLPVTILILLKTSYNFLIMKNSVLLVKTEDYMLTARSKGMKEHRVLKIHLLRNALAPYLTNVFMQFGYAMAGVMTLEAVFSWQGMGNLMSSAAQAKDYPVLQLCFLMLCVCVMITNLLADFVGAAVDPRLRRQGGME